MDPQAGQDRSRARSAGSGLTSLATLPLGSGRTLHLVRAGRDYLLVGTAEHGVAPIHRYTEEQARDAGLLDLAEPRVTATGRYEQAGLASVRCRSPASGSPRESQA